MTLRLRHLRLRAETSEGRFGADIPLADGLMIIRADNSTGKSTSTQSFLFALGLERMIAAKPTHVVTAAMRDRLIFDPHSKDETPVLASWVSLEIEGLGGEIATLTRWVKHETLEPGLIRVVHGPQLTDPGKYPAEDFYVGRGGAATNPRGFHRWLAEFIGWTMPQLPTNDGRLAQLYMEQVFPLLFVEQRRGWGGIQAQMPYFSGLSGVRQRSIEFLLDLEVGKIEADRQQLRAKENAIQDEWRTVVRDFKNTLVGHGLVAIRLPEALTSAWPPPEAPFVAESRDESWVDIVEVLAQLRREEHELDARELPRIQASAHETEDALGRAQEEAVGLRHTSAAIRESIARDRSELVSLDERLAALREDLREHKDIVTLQRLGSPELERLHGDCPVCHQELPESLLDSAPQARALTPEDSVEYIKQQIELFTVIAEDSRHALQAKTESYAALRRRSAQARSAIRALRATLTGPNGAPSTEAIAQQIRLQDRIESLDLTVGQFDELLAELARLADRGRELRGQLQRLPPDRLSASDQEKIASLQQSFLAQLQEYDFGSFSSDGRLSISSDDYLPRRAEFDLQADISASDSIRVIWAYLLALLEVGTEHATNHPGLIVFDEPRQQSAKKVSFAALLKRAAAEPDRSQIIFATSEEQGSLEDMLKDLPHTLHAIDGYVLKRVTD